MFRCLRGTALGAAIFFNCGSAYAVETDSANQAMAGCRRVLNPAAPHPPLEAMDGAYCIGVVVGLSFASRGRDICPPAAVTKPQAVRVVVKYIDDRPERMHENFLELAHEALRSAFPCKK
jgi:Rap1a immunity proteins